MSLVNTPYLIHAYDNEAYPRTHGKLFWLYYVNDVAFPAGQGYRLVIRSGIGKEDDAYYFLLERKMSGGRRCFVYCLGISENAGGLAVLDLERNAVRKLMGLMHIRKDDKIYCFTFMGTKARCWGIKEDTMSLQPVFGARGIGFLGEYVDADSSSACNITEAVKTIKEAFV